MIRKFRAIVESIKEPEDHEVLWYYQGNLYYFGKNAWEPFLNLDASEISYISEEDSSISNIKEALDKLMYVTPIIKSFRLAQSGTYEKGLTINKLDFSWQYNKNKIKEQSLNNINLPIDLREITLQRTVYSNMSFVLKMNDGTTETSATTSIRFIEYIYYGTKLNDTNVKKLKVSPSAGGLTITANKNEYIWIFIPKSSGFTKIWNNNVDSTDDFNREEYTYTADTNAKVVGTLYTSKNHSLNEVILKFT